jgi:tryptophanyl-tRNA synthetase
MAHPEQIEELLQIGVMKARAIAAPLLKQVREAVGLRKMNALPAVKEKAVKVALPTFKQFRLEDGQFYFNFSDAAGRLLLTSSGFASGKDAGQWVGKLKKDGVAALTADAPVTLAEGVSSDDVAAALVALTVE